MNLHDVNHVEKYKPRHNQCDFICLGRINRSCVKCCSRCYKTRDKFLFGRLHSRKDNRIVVTSIGIFLTSSLKRKFHDCIKKKMWYYPQKTKMTQTLTTIGHRTAFNNEQSPYRIVSYKRPR